MLVETIIALLLIFTVALLFSPIGLGGGILFVPILHYVLGWTLEEAMIGSLSLVWMVSLGSMVAHHQQGKEDARAAKVGLSVYVPAAVLGSMIGYFLLENVSELFVKASVIFLMSFVLLNTLEQMKMEKTHINSTQMESKAQKGNLETDTTENHPLARYEVGCGIGGLSAGILGIGGGAVMVMLGRSYAGLGSHTAAGTSYSVEFIGVPAALAVHLWTNGGFSTISHLASPFAVALVCASVAAVAWTGATTAIKLVPSRLINTSFVLIVSVGLLRYIYDFSSLLL